MSRSRKPLYLQKPKRIRKSKKEFLRGNAHINPAKIHTEHTIIPLPYILLFFLFISTVIGYVSILFLISKIHIDNNIYNYTRASLPTIELPTITLPHIAVPIPHISIPEITVPPVAKPIEAIAARSAETIFYYLNPIPYWTNAFTITAQAIALTILWIAGQIMLFGVPILRNTQTQGASFLRSIHPTEMLHQLLSAINMTIVYAGTSIGNGTVWIGKTGIEYIILLGSLMRNLVSILVNSAEIIGSMLVKTVSTSILTLFALGIQHITYIYQHIFLGVVTISGFLENLQRETNAALITMATWIWHFCITVILYILDGITIVFHEIIFILESTWKFIVHIGILVAVWCLSILTAIKKWFDNIFGAIGAFIHLGDPLYGAIGESIGSLFSSIGETLSLTSKALQGGRL